MTKRVLAIGVGGSGKASLTLLKERLEETYGEVPENVVLLSIDTDDLRAEDQFAGTRLSAQFDNKGREPEFRHVVSKPGVTMDTIFADMATEKSTAYMYWLEKEKLGRMLGPAERDIRGGAQQRRPVGRVALFQRWDNPIVSSIREGIERIYGEPETEMAQVDKVKKEQSKRLVFIIGSMAGGTGSGFLIDIANLVRFVIQSNSQWQSIDTSAVIVLPDAFSSYTSSMQDPTNLKPNSYAALREMDRFIRTHSNNLPYMVRYGDDIRSITWGINQVVDHAYLVDTASPSGIGDFDLSGNPMRGVFPVVADFVMAHVDEHLGDSLATLRSNAGLHYNKEEGWQYSSFNLLTYIFPVDDVIESFSYRFLREMLYRLFLPPEDKKKAALLDQEAAKHTERVFGDNSVGGKVNPGIVQKAIAATKPIQPESPDVSWAGLFNLVALSEGGFAEDYKHLEEWLAYLLGNLLPSKEGEYKHENFDDGYTRLLTFADHFMQECLGPKYDPDNEDARQGGEWDNILSRYREALRLRFAQALDVAILEVLNKRDPNNKVIAMDRLPFAQGMVRAMKEKLVKFRHVLEHEYRGLKLDDRVRRTGEDLRNSIVWMQDTKDSKTWAIFGKPEARQAQDAYIGLFYDKMSLMLHQRIYNTVVDILDALGAADKDKDGNLSVVDQAALELENWQATFQDVEKILNNWSRVHEKNRSEKNRVRVRRYLTNPEFEEQLYTRPDIFNVVAARVYGQVQGLVGIEWRRLEETEALNFKIITTWAEEARGADAMASEFFAGSKKLYQFLREKVTVADRIASEFKEPSRFVNVVNQVNEPFLRYNPATNGKQMFHEHYVSYNLDRSNKDAQNFLDRAQGTLADTGFNVVSNCESRVACAVIEVARGAKLDAVEQFNACQVDYWNKIFGGRESLHLFPEEQLATAFEGQIESLNEPENRRRRFAPDLVVAMGEEAKLRAFTLACAYGVIEPGTYYDDKGEESTEIMLNLPGRTVPLSNSRAVRELDNHFNAVNSIEQRSRLYLNALQNFALIATQKPGVPGAQVANLVDSLKKLGANPGNFQLPFTLSLREINEAIRAKAEELGPGENLEPDKKRREQYNARNRLDRYLLPYMNETVKGFKNSPVQRVKDMGTLMHLLLNPIINDLCEKATGAH